MENNKIPVFLASDDNYAPFVATTIVSILNNTKSFVSFYILDSGISDENKRKIARISDDYSNFSIEYIKIDIQKEFGNFPLYQKEHTLNVFSRYLIPQIKPELKKVLYLDVDIIVKGDLLELYNINLEKYHLAAIPEYTDVLEDHKNELKISSTHKYFNAGVLIIDCEYFRKSNLTNFLIKKTLEIKPKFQDQDIFNIVFEDNYKILDYKYNVSWYMNEFNKKKPNDYVQEAIENPFIIHYSTFKPWKDLNTVFNEEFWRYARKTFFYEFLLLEMVNSKISIPKDDRITKIFNKILDLFHF